jgi:hypothetical protein
MFTRIHRRNLYLLHSVSAGDLKTPEGARASCTERLLIAAVTEIVHFPGFRPSHWLTSALRTRALALMQRRRHAKNSMLFQSIGNHMN